MNWHSFFFLLFALIACAFAVAVVLTSNIVRMAFYLTLSLGATAGLFFLAGADFVGAMQLLIYVGGTLVLLIFGVMLTAQAHFITMKIERNQWVIVAIVGGSLLFLLLTAAFRVPEWRLGSEVAESQEAAASHSRPTATPLGMALLGVRVDTEEVSEEKQPGLAGYLLPFEIISVHLLVVLIGSAYLARAKRRARSRALE
ncbi:MAG: NADH-quinone oxidoreductase subunit J [Pirellulales bacterium]